MKTYKSIYFLFITILLFSCTQDQRNIASRLNASVSLLQLLTKTEWVQVDLLGKEFSKNSTYKFSKDGQFSKIDQFDYLGIKETIEENGVWEINESSKTIEMENILNRYVNHYRIIPQNKTKLKLISLDGGKDLVLNSANSGK